MEDIIDFLQKENISENLLAEMRQYRATYSAELSDADKKRIPSPRFLYYGKDVWEKVLAAVLCGQNVLLSGHKATGKNILAENLANVFSRPLWNMSFHVNTDAASLIGTDTFKDGKVVFREGPVYRCAASGGFGVLDEINMAKNEAIAVLHAMLDFRRTIDVPGYDRIPVHKATRFIATMNYGYAGTRELNEALASRFVVIDMPEIERDNLLRLLKSEFSGLQEKWAGELCELFFDIQAKANNAEISSRALDLRGLLDAVNLMQKNICVCDALDMGLTNKAFDDFERTLVHDIIHARFAENVAGREMFS